MGLSYYHPPINITKAALLALQTAGTLEVGATYNVTDSTNSIGIVILATGTTTLDLINCSRTMYCPRTYAVTTDGDGNVWKGVWNSGLTPAAGNLAIWGGQVWSNVAGAVGTATNDVTLSAAWTLIPRTSFTLNRYIPMTHNCSYDLTNNWVNKQLDGNGNIFGVDFLYETNVLGYGYNICDLIDWNYETGGGLFLNNTCLGVFNNAGNRDIYFNSNSGFIYQNTSTGGIYKNSNGGDVYLNSNAGAIRDNSNLGNISQNSNNGGIYLNSCLQSIANNTNAVADINNLPTSNIKIASKAAINGAALASTTLTLFNDALLSDFIGAYAIIKYASGTLGIAAIRIKNDAGYNCATTLLATVISTDEVMIPLFGAWRATGSVSVEVTTASVGASTFDCYIFGVARP